MREYLGGDTLPRVSPVATERRIPSGCEDNFHFNGGFDFNILTA